MNETKLTKWQWLEFALTGLFFFVLCLGQLERWQVTGNVALYAHDVLLFVLLALKVPWWLTQVHHWKQRYNLRQDWLVILLVGWAVAGWILALINGQPLVVAFLYFGRLLAYLAWNWQLLHATWWPKLLPWVKNSETVLVTYWLMGIFTMYLGFLQYFLVPDIRFMGTFGWDVHLYRLVGAQLDPNITGALLILTLFLTLELRFLRPVVKIILAVISMASIALTYSRSTYGAVVVGLLSWAFMKRAQTRQVLFSLGLIATLVAMIFLLPRPGGEGVKLERTASGVARIEASQSALSDMSPLNWLLGRGLFVPGNFTQASEVILGQHAQLADNVIILFLSGIGVGGLGLLLLILYRNRRVLGQLSLLATASTLAILAHSQFNNTLFQPFVWLMLSAIILTSFKYGGGKTKNGT